jgi:glycosyltransferase involved in cell wall biosynthesis
LNALYSGATCFVYPSYFEGFGLPILEAMKCGTPVIAGNRTSIPEVAGEAALLFDPFDVNSMVEALRRILSDAPYRAALSAKGLQRANEFNWQTTARLTLAVYEKAAGQTVNQYPV